MYKVENAIFQPWAKVGRDAMRQLAKDEDYVRISLQQDERGKRGVLEDLMHVLMKKVGDFVLAASQQRRQVRQVRGLVQEEQVEREYLVNAQEHRRMVLEQIVIKESITRLCLERCERQDCSDLDLDAYRARLAGMLEEQAQIIADVVRSETRARASLEQYEYDTRRHRHDCYIGERYEIRRRASVARKSNFLCGHDGARDQSPAVGLTPSAPITRPSFFTSPDVALYNRQALYSKKWREGESNFTARCPSASPTRNRDGAPPPAPYQPTPPRPDQRPASAPRVRPAKFAYAPRTPERPQTARCAPQGTPLSPAAAMPAAGVPESSGEETVGHESWECSGDNTAAGAAAAPRASMVDPGDELDHLPAVDIMRADYRGRDAIAATQKDEWSDLLLAFRRAELQLLSQRYERPVYKTAEDDDTDAGGTRQLTAREYTQQVRDELETMLTGGSPSSSRARAQAADRARAAAAATASATAHGASAPPATPAAPTTDEAQVLDYYARRVQRAMRRWHAQRQRRAVVRYNAERVARDEVYDAKARAIQRAARGYVAKKQAGSRRASARESTASRCASDKERDSAACAIQRMARCCVARAERRRRGDAVRDALETEVAEHTAAARIQSVHRGNMARAGLASPQKPTAPPSGDKAAAEAEAAAATRIQAVHRGNEARKEATARRQSIAKENAAATKIQAVHRGNEARKEAAGRRQSVAEENAAATKSQPVPNESAAATKIQAVHRGNQARKEAAGRRQSVANENAAATKIQAVHRGNEARKEATARQQSVAKENAAATKIQAMHRGNEARKEAAGRRQSVAEENAAATKIQAVHRGKEARKEAAERRAEEERKAAAATKIQALHRGNQARKEVEERRENEYVTDRPVGAAPRRIRAAPEKPAVGSAFSKAERRIVKCGPNMKPLLACVQQLMKDSVSGITPDSGIALFLHPSFLDADASSLEAARKVL